MKSKLTFILSLAIAFFLFFSCDPDDPVIPPEPELITTLNYTLTPSSGGDAITLSFQDLDGDGGDAPSITEGTLAANTSYSGSIELLNESETPTENITEEIKEEDEDHQFFFQSSLVTVSYNDEDSDGNPIGLSSTLTTSAAGSGNLTIILRHEPNKSASGVSDGEIANAGGESDIEVTFAIDVE